MFCCNHNIKHQLIGINDLESSVDAITPSTDTIPQPQNPRTQKLSVFVVYNALFMLKLSLRTLFRSHKTSKH